MFCIPIIGRNTEEALEKMVRAAPLADVLEIRLDLMERFDLNEIIKVAPKPLLVTYRSKREGGGGEENPESITDILLTAIQKGADFVDVEFSLPATGLKRIIQARGSADLILSTHIQDGTPSREKLEKIFRDMTNTGAGTIKIVTRAGTMMDNLRVLDLIPQARELGIKIIAFCMGPAGKISRVLSHVLGGYMTFASLEKGDETASGQIPITDMKKILEVLETCL